MKRNIIKPSILPGFMELLPKEQEIFNDIVSKIKRVYEDNGCLAIDTPIIEKAEVLLAKSGGETEKQVYSFQKGRYREFYQCDIDVIGKEKLSIDNDAWVISLASKAFKAIGLNNYRFQISNRKILKGILSELKIDTANEVMILIDKYDKMGKEIFSNELESLIGTNKSQYINKVLDIKGNNKERIEELLKLNIKNKDFIEGVEELNKVCYILDILGVSDDEFEINLKIIRGLDYYTGTVFETILVGNEEYGSICSGGRYENLAKNYTNNILPGVGISIGLTRLFFVLKEIGFIDKYEIKKGLDYLIIPIGNTIKYCVEVMRCLQEKGNRVTVYFEEDSLKKKMNYANKIGVSNVILIGEEEVEKNEVKIKNMDSGESKSMDYRLL